MHLRMIISLTSVTPLIIAGTLTACGPKTGHRSQLPVKKPSYSYQKDALVQGLASSKISKTFVQEALEAINNPLKYSEGTTSFRLQSSPLSEGFFCMGIQTPFDYLDVTSRRDQNNELSFAIKTHCQGESIEQVVEKEDLKSELGNSDFDVKIACQENCTQDKEILHILMSREEAKILLTAKTNHLTFSQTDKNEAALDLEKSLNRGGSAHVQIVSNTVDFNPTGAKINLIFTNESGQEQNLLLHAGYWGTYSSEGTQHDFIEFLKFSGSLSEQIKEAQLVDLKFEKISSVEFLKSATLILKVEGQEDRIELHIGEIINENLNNNKSDENKKRRDLERARGLVASLADSILRLQVEERSV